MLNKIIYFLRKEKLLKEVQYLLSKKLDDKNDFNITNSLNYISKVQKECKDLNIHSSLYTILFDQVSIKKLEIENVDIESIKSISQINRDLINTKRHLFNEQLYETLMFQIDYLRVKAEVKDWYKQINVILQEKSLLIESKENIKKDINDKLDKLEINSSEYIELKKKYVELNVEIVRIKTEPLLENNITLYNIGSWYESYIETLRQKILKSSLLIIDNNGNLVMKNNAKNMIGIYNDLLIEKLKINFYLNKENKYLFKSVKDLMVCLINSNVKDPIAYLMKCGDIQFENNELHINHIKEKTFNYYLGCFVLNIKNVKGEIKMHLLQLDKNITPEEANKYFENNKR